LLLVLGHLVFGEDRLGRAFGFAQGAVDALVRVNDQEVRAFVEAVHRADFHAVGVFALDAVVGDDEGHGLSLSSGDGWVWSLPGSRSKQGPPRLMQPGKLRYQKRADSNSSRAGRLYPTLPRI